MGAPSVHCSAAPELVTQAPFPSKLPGCKGANTIALLHIQWSRYKLLSRPVG